MPKPEPSSRMPDQADLQAQGEAGKAVAAALAQLSSGEIPDRERKWEERIEAMRDDLEASEEQLAVRYFGVGFGDHPPSAEEARAGRLITGHVRQAAAASLPHEDCLLLHLLVRHLRPTACLELGTCLGISGAYLAAALELNEGGALVSLEGAESLADLARRNLRTLGLGRAEIRIGRFQDTLGPVLEEGHPVDFAFIDGHHEEEATVRYFRQILQHHAPSAVVVFDDIAWSEGMTRAWERVSSDDRVQLPVDLGRLGLCILT